MFILLFVFSAGQNIYLSDRNFSQYLRKSDRSALFLEFWATWCPFCREFSKTWENFSSEVQPFDVANIECESNPRSCKGYTSLGLPNLVWFDIGDDNGVVYKGGKSLESLNQFVRKQINFPLQVLDNFDAEGISKSSFSSSKFVFTFPSPSSSEVELAKGVASKFRSHLCEFFVVFDEKANASLEAFNGNKGRHVFSGEYCEADLTNFVVVHLYPIFTRLNNQVAEVFLSYRSPLLAIIATGNVTDADIRVAYSMSELIPVVSANCTELQFFCRYTNAINGDIKFVMWDKPKGLYWSQSREISSQEAVSWLHSVRNGTLKGSGPGKGFISIFTAPLYDSYAEGVANLVITCCSPLVVILAVYLLLSGYRTSKKE